MNRIRQIVKRRAFWIIAALMTAAVIFYFSSQNTQRSEALSDSIAGILRIEQLEEGTKVSNQRLIFGLTLRKLAHVFLFAVLGFCLCFVYDGVRLRFPLAAGTGYLYGVFDEIHQTLAGRYGRWQDTLIDLGGVLIGLLAAVLILYLIRKFRPDGGKE